MRFNPRGGFQAGSRYRFSFVGDWTGTALKLCLSLKGEELLEETIQVGGDTLEMTCSLVQNQIFHTNTHDAGLFWSPGASQPHRR